MEDLLKQEFAYKLCRHEHCLIFLATQRKSEYSSALQDSLPLTLLTLLGISIHVNFNLCTAEVFRPYELVSFSSSHTCNNGHTGAEVVHLEEMLRSYLNRYKITSDALINLWSNLDLFLSLSSFRIIVATH